MKKYIRLNFEVTAAKLDDVITSSVAVKDTGVDTPLVSMTPGVPSVGMPGLNK